MTKKIYHTVVLTHWNNNWSDDSRYCFPTLEEAQAFADSRDDFSREEHPEGSNTWYNNGCEASRVGVIEGIPSEWEGVTYVEGYQLIQNDTK